MSGRRRSNRPGSARHVPWRLDELGDTDVRLEGLVASSSESELHQRAVAGNLEQARESLTASRTALCGLPAFSSRGTS